VRAGTEKVFPLRDHVFGECLQHDYSLLFAFVFLGTTTVRDRSCGKEDRHCYLSALHRAGRLHRQVLCRLAPA
jgi:hypothetical protein